MELSDTRALSGRDKKHLVLLIWLITSGVPGHALTTPNWKDVTDEFGIELCERTTLWKFLPLLRSVALLEEEKVLCSLSSFVTSIDLWTSLAHSHYLVVNYYGIVPTEEFRPWNATLDLIPFYSGASSPVIVSVICTAIERHTQGNPSIIHAGNVSDQGANVKLAGIKLTNEGDQLDCFNHHLKLIIDDVFGHNVNECGSCVMASKDLIGLNTLVHFIRSHSHIRRTFDDEQASGLALISDNITRWEGKYSSLERALLLMRVIRKVCKKFKPEIIKLAKDLGSSCPQRFLSKDYTKRLGELKEFLEPIHRISQKAQSLKKPTASSVIKWTWGLEQHCKIFDTDSPLLTTLKQAFADSLQVRMGIYRTKVTTYLKCSLMDTRYCGKLSQYGISKKLLNTAWNELLLICEDLFPTEYENHKESFELALKALRGALEATHNKNPYEFWRSSKYGGMSHSLILNSYVSMLRPLAAMLLAFPCGEAASERDFSYTGRIITKGRTRTSDTTLEDMLLVRNWAMKEMYSKAVLFSVIEDLMRKNNESND